MANPRLPSTPPSTRRQLGAKERQAGNTGDRAKGVVRRAILVALAAWNGNSKAALHGTLGKLAAEFFDADQFSGGLAAGAPSRPMNS